MKLALYLPNFRDKVTVKELEDLTGLAEELDFDSVWTLDRIVVPEASDRAGAAVLVRHDDRVPEGAAGVLARRVAAGLAADPVARGEDDEGADRHEHHRHAVPRARRPGRRDRHRRPPLQRPGQRGRRVGLDARGVRRRQRLAHLPQAAPARARDDRDHAGHLDERPLRVPRRVRRLRPVRVRSEAACSSRTRRSSSAGSRTRSARRAASPSTACRAGSGSRTRPTSSQQWRSAIQRELEELGSSRSIDDLEICSMIWFVITDAGDRPDAAGQGQQPVGGDRRRRSPTSSSATRRPG